MVRKIFSPIKKKSLTESVIEEINSLIQRGIYKPGDKLPTEWKLCEKLGVSRTALREGLKTLHQLGVIEIKVGNGTYVRAGNPSAVIGKHLKENLLSPEDINSLLEVRRILEPHIAEIVVERGTKKDIEKIIQVVKKMRKLKEQGKSFSREDATFHKILAESTHNPLLVAIVESIIPFIVNWVYKREELIEPEEVVKLHEEIVNALVKKDKKASSKGMEKHLEHIESIVGKMKVDKRKMKEC